MNGQSKQLCDKLQLAQPQYLLTLLIFVHSICSDLLIFVVFLTSVDIVQLPLRNLRKAQRTMPKVRRSKKPPPEGWELIEPTLDELDQKMREGKHSLILLISHMPLSFVFFYRNHQLKLSRMRVNASKSRCGPSSRYTTRSRATFTTCSTGGRQSVGICTISAWMRKLRIGILLPSGRNLVTRICAACAAFRQGILTSARIVSVECPKESLRRLV